MGTGIAKKLGNAGGVKVPTEFDRGKEKHSPYAEREKDGNEPEANRGARPAGSEVSIHVDFSSRVRSRSPASVLRKHGEGQEARD